MPNRVSNVTWNHDEIRRWAEERGGVPAAVKGTGRGKSDAGILRIDFPGYRGARRLGRITWEEFFEKFDESKLAMVYEDRTASGQWSNFSKLVRRDTVARGGRSARPRSTKVARTLTGMAAVGASRARRSSAAGRPAGSRSRKTAASSRTRRTTKVRAAKVGVRRPAARGERRAGAASSARTSRARTASRAATRTGRKTSRGGRRVSRTTRTTRSRR